MNEAPPRRWQARDHLPSLGLFLAGLVVTFAVAHFVRVRAQREQRDVLERRAGQVTATLAVSQTMWLEVLHHLDSFFRSSDDVTRADFRDFSRPALARHREVAALEWFPLVHDADVPALEAKAHEDGLMGYRVRQLDSDGQMVIAESRPEHLPLFYMEPMSDSAMGLDLLSSDLRSAPARRARDSGLPMVSGRLRLVEDPAGVWSVAVYVPFYRRGEPIATEAERRAAFAGVIVEVFRLQPTFEKALAGVDLAALGITLEDDSASGEDRLLYDVGIAPRGDLLTSARPLPFAGRDWKLRFRAAPEGLINGIAPAAVVAGGLVMSLVAAFLLSAWRTVLRLRRQVAASRSVGQYTLIERLGEGGMGVVYKATHALLRRPTAVKILIRERAAEADIRRFEREVQITGRLTHPNTVVVFDYGRTPDRRFYYAMEFIDGITLERLVAQFGPQPAGRVQHILVQACGALAEAHGEGLIHRDVKPANFMLCQRGGVPDFIKVLDFGMVKEGGIVSDVSETGVSYGTPLYLAPEAIQDPHAIDARADLYALGLVGYYLLAGRRAVSGQSLAEVMHQHLTVVPSRPSERLGSPLPEGLERVIMRCLAKDPLERPESADALRRELLELHDVDPWTDDVAAAWWRDKKDELMTQPSTPVALSPMDIAMSER